MALPGSKEMRPSSMRNLKVNKMYVESWHDANQAAVLLQ